MGRPSSKSTFKESWKLDSAFSDWLQTAASKHEFFCSWCKTTRSLSNMGKTALQSHAAGKEHSAIRDAKRSASIMLYTQKQNESKPQSTQSEASQSVGVVAVPVNTVSGSECQSSFKTSSLQESFLLRDEVTDAEIIWCLAAVYHHLSLSSAGSCAKYFPLMFKSSPAAEKMSIGNNKMGYIIVFGLGKYFREEIFDQVIRNADMFTISFDESLNKFVQKEQMDIHVRYWCTSKNECITHYIGSAFLRGCTAIDLLDAFKSQLNLLNFKKLIQVSTDGPNVNIKFHRDLQDHLNELFDPVDQFTLLNIGNCGLHVLNNSFKTAFKKIDWGIADVLRSMYDLFHNTPARRADFIKHGKSSIFPLKFCGVRWLENAPVAERCMLLLDPLKLYIKGVSGTDREPTSKCYEKLKKSVKDPMLKPRLAFFLSIAKHFEPVLKTYQAEKPLVPFLYDDYTRLLENLMSIIVKSDILNKKRVTSIDVTKPENLILATKIEYGHAVREVIRQNRESISNENIINFKKDILQCIQLIVVKILEKSPLKYSLTRTLSFCNPFLISRCLKKKSTLHEERLKSSLDKLVEMRQIGGVVADQIEKDFRKLCSTPGVAERMETFKRKTDRLDRFWFDLIKHFEGSSQLLNLLKKIFILFHGNAAVERGFSVNKEVVVENQLEKSLVAMRMVHASIQSQGGVDKVVITKKMRIFVRNARSEYHSYLKEEKEEKSKADSLIAVQKRKAEELKVLESKKKKIIEDAKIQSEMIDEQIRNYCW